MYFNRHILTYSPGSYIVAFVFCAILNRFNFPIGYSFQVSSKGAQI
jgi:hypothetical protein